MATNPSPTVAELRGAHEDRMKHDEVLAIDYHRNGIGGEGFYVALVRVADAEQRVLTVIAPEWAIEAGTWRAAAKKSPAGGVPCYAIDPALASGPWTKPGTVAFGENSWRGENYFDLLVKAAAERA